MLMSPISRYQMPRRTWCREASRLLHSLLTFTPAMLSYREIKSVQSHGRGASDGARYCRKSASGRETALVYQAVAPTCVLVRP